MSSNSEANLTNEQKKNLNEYDQLMEDHKYNHGKYRQSVFFSQNYPELEREQWIKENLSRFGITIDEINERIKKMNEIYQRIKPIVDERQKKADEAYFKRLLNYEKKLEAEREEGRKKYQEKMRQQQQQQQSKSSQQRQTSIYCQDLLRQYGITDKQSFKDFLLKYHPDKSGFAPGTKDYEEITEIFKKVYPCAEPIYVKQSQGGKRKTRRNKRKFSRRRR